MLRSHAIRRAVLLTAMLSLVACHAGRASVAAAPSRPAPVTASARPGHGDLCTALEAQMRAAHDALDASALRAADAQHVRWAGAHDGGCARTTHGAWAMVIDSVEVTARDDMHGETPLVVLDSQVHLVALYARDATTVLRSAPFTWIVESENDEAIPEVTLEARAVETPAGDDTLALRVANATPRASGLRNVRWRASGDAITEVPETP